MAGKHDWKHVGKQSQSRSFAEITCLLRSSELLWDWGSSIKDARTKEGQSKVFCGGERRGLRQRGRWTSTQMLGNLWQGASFYWCPFWTTLNWVEHSCCKPKHSCSKRWIILLFERILSKCRSFRNWGNRHREVTSVELIASKAAPYVASNRIIRAVCFIKVHFTSTELKEVLRRLKIHKE